MIFWKPVFLLWMLFLMASLSLFGQVTGWVKEKETNQSRADATIYLLRADSSFLAQTHSHEDGSFVLSGRLLPGQYLVLVSAPDLESLCQKLVLTDTLPLDIGVFYLLAKRASLQAVIVRPSSIRPHFRGDTVEYTTGLIKMRPNASVEEMLGRLPGLQIDANGNITYNGQKISRLLVDGEDFFGSDPSLVTRNFDASKIDKVQILDRKSDQAIFTGIDDGSRTRTLNLVMKPDSRKGYFGKAEGGANPQGNFIANSLLAAFEKREQFAVLGFASNTGSTGFSGNLGGSSAAGISFLNTNSDALGASAGTGIPHFFGTALHYANTWDGLDDHLLANYQYSNLFTQPVTTSVSLQTLPDSVYEQYRQSHSTNRQNQHWFYGRYEGVLDSVSAIQFGLSSTSTAAGNQYGDTALSTLNGVTVNKSLRTIQDKVSRKSIGGDLDYRLRARHQPGRVFAVHGGWSSFNSSTSGYLYSIDRFFRPDGSLQSGDTTDQRKQVVNQSLNLNGGLSFAMPLWPRALLGLTYGLSYSGSKTVQGTYDKGDDKYTLYVDSLSSHLRGYTVSQQGAFNLQGGDSRLSYTLGTGLLWYSYRQRDLKADSMSKYRYVNLSPQLRVSYTPDRLTHLNFEYAGSPQPPSIKQLQPIVNNTNPLLITLGNPNLRTGFNQSWTISFSRATALMYHLDLNFGVARNSISTRTTTDSLGKQTSQPVNVNGGKNGSLYFSANTRLKSMDADLSVHGSLAYSRSVNYVNASLSKNDSYTGGSGFSFSKYVADRYRFQVNTDFLYAKTTSSINHEAVTSYWTQNHIAVFGFFPFKNWEVNTSCNYNWRQKTSAFDEHNSSLLWSASVNRNLLDNHLSISFQFNDILNQNSGITRTIAANQVSQTTSNVIGRYLLLSVLYRFTHKGKSEKQKD